MTLSGTGQSAPSQVDTSVHILGCAQLVNVSSNHATVSPKPWDGDWKVSNPDLSKKNVWMSDKSWEPGSFLMFSYVFQCFLTFSNVTYSHSHSLSLSHSLTLSHSHTLSISHWITLDMLNNFCFHLYAQKSLSHSHTLTLSLSHTLSLSLSHSFNLSFTHSRHAEQVLFSSLCSKFAVYRRKLQCFFFDHHHSTPSTDIRVHRAGSQLKIAKSKTGKQGQKQTIIWHAT